MTDPGADPAELQKDLDQLARKGIQADRQRLLQDMCAQFADWREWIREFVVNAADAQARHAWVAGREDEDTLTITVSDDGHGMDKAGVQDFMTVYRSRKSGDPRRVVGQHGIGKLSVAAIPGQSRFSLVTSTGAECWRMGTGPLLAETPVKLEREDPAPPAGTRFEVTFKKPHGLAEELRRLGDVLHRYARFLPIEILVLEPRDRAPRLVHEDWSGSAGRCGRAFKFKLENMGFEVSLGVGGAAHEVYQRRVLVSSKYDLLFRDLGRAIAVPHLRVRVDSPDFTLPFGRHCLRNEDILGPLARHIRERLLPPYVAELNRHYLSATLEDIQVSPLEVEEISCALLQFDDSPSRTWSRTPLFATVHHLRLSLQDLREEVRKQRTVFLEAKEGAGLDYGLFDGPVLSRQQIAGALPIVQQNFPAELMNLGVKDSVMEAPPGCAKLLGPREQEFQRHLRFHPAAVEAHGRETGPTASPSREELELTAGSVKEIENTRQDLASLTWRVNYLVGADARTACLTRRFMVWRNAVILNLHHPEIAQLVRLSEKDPALAAHWAMALCLLESNHILPHLTAEAREDLILLDAVAKCGSKPPVAKEPEPPAEADAAWRSFLRNNQDPRFGAAS